MGLGCNFSHSQTKKSTTKSMVKDQSLLLFHSLASHNPLLSKPCKFPKTVTLNDGHQMKCWIRPRYYWSIVASCVISFIFTFQNKQISQKKQFLPFLTLFSSISWIMYSSPFECQHHYLRNDSNCMVQLWNLLQGDKGWIYI